MGLDITAYSNLKKLDCLFNRDGEPVDPVTREEFDCDTTRQFFHNESFTEQADDIEDKGVYSFGDSLCFHAGTYGGYNRWRDKLAEIAGYRSASFERYGITSDRHDAGAWVAESGPFYELINFSDCEGVIGAKTAAKLAKDFADFQDRADAVPDEYFKEKYASWRTAFELAAQNGAVEFH